MPDTGSNPAPLGASVAPIPAENGSREVEYAPPPPGSERNVGSDDGVAARTRLQVHLRNAAWPFTAVRVRGIEHHIKIKLARVFACGDRGLSERGANNS